MRRRLHQWQGPLRRCWLLLCLALTPVLVRAQEATETPDAAPQSLPLPGISAEPTQVFLIRDYLIDGSDRLVFTGVASGSERTLDVNGVNYGVVGGEVWYTDRATNRTMIIGDDATPREHPFIQPGVNALRVDWRVSADETWVAWTETTGTPDALTTVTRVARLDGSEARDLLTDGPRDGVRVFPVGFSDDSTRLYLDYQPDTIGDITPFRQYAGLFAVDLATGETESLPGEPGCFCGAGIGGDWFLRLRATPEGFDLAAYNLNSGGAAQIIPAVTLPQGFTQGGDILIAADGSRAIYGLARVQNFGTPQQTLQTLFVLVDLTTMTQTPLFTEPISTLIRPIAWTEDNAAVIFTNPVRNGTWKAILAEETLRIVAEAAFLGNLSAP